MSYSKGANLPGQSASKLGHLAVIQSDWVRSLVSEFDKVEPQKEDPSNTLWKAFDRTGVIPLRNVWAVDGSFVSIKSESILVFEYIDSQIYSIISKIVTYHLFF